MRLGPSYDRCSHAHQADVAKCRREAYGDGLNPANTFLVINALAIPGMLLEIDVTAVVAK